MMTIRNIIFSEMSCVASEQKKVLPPLSDDLELTSVGLDSLCFAILVARLEDTLGADPFSAENVRLPVTLRDFITLYEGGSVAAHHNDFETALPT